MTIPRDHVALPTQGVLCFNAPARSYPEWKRQKIEKFLQEHLAEGWLEPSDSRVSSELIFVPKPDGEDRPVIDYRKLNEHLWPLVYAPETGYGTRNWIHRHKYFSKWDCEKAFYRMKIRQQDRWKTAIRTPFGKYQATVMQMGIGSAPGEYQMFLEWVLHGLIGRHLHVHIDDIILGTNDEITHAQLEQEIDSRLSQAGIRTNRKKRIQMTQDIIFAGIRYFPSGMSSAYDVTTFETWPVPKTKKELQSFLGAVSWNAPWIPRLHHLAHELWTANTWTSQINRAFLATRDLAAKSIAEAPHDPLEFTEMYTDASDFAIAALTVQSGRVTAVYSRKLTPSERKWGAPDRELLAITESLKRWYDILAVSKGITCWTDNEINATSISPDNTNPRKARAIEVLTCFRLRLRHVKGVLNPADGPSRRADYA